MDPGEGQVAARAALREALGRLDRLAPHSSARALAELADEILATAALLKGQPRLRRALSDPGRAPADRADLLASLLGAKIQAEALELLQTLVAGRWSTPGALLNGTEQLGVEALLASADRAGELAEVEDELFRFGQTVEANVELAAALGSSTDSPQQRGRLAHSLLADKVRPATLRLVELALQGFGGRSFLTSLTRMVELAALRQERQIAYVRVAAPLREPDERRLADRLSQIYGRAMEIKVSVDPSLLGGMSVQVGHDLYDGTLSRRLQQARTALTGSS